MKRLTALALTIIIAAACLSTFITARYVELPFGGIASVTEVFEGNAIEVRLDNGTLALVRLAGVETGGCDVAYEWLKREILGMRVRLEPEINIRANNRWNHMYVFLGNELINAKTLQQGNGRVSANIANFRHRQALIDAENFARLAGTGIWYTPPLPPPAVIHQDRVNINTVTLTYLMEQFGFDWLMASRFIAYRNTNPFRTVNDVKFVPEMTKAIFDDIRHHITTTTDINTASYREIMSLGTMREEWADAIIEYRKNSVINELIDPFLTIPGFAWVSTFQAIRFHVTTTNFTAVITPSPNATVNINTASHDRLVAAGLSANQAQIIITQRGMYHIKTLYDLMNVTSLGFSVTAINALADNLTTRTEINTATEYEIRSLFNIAGTNADITSILRNRPFSDIGQLRNNVSEAGFALIEPYIFIEGMPTHYVNVNTATMQQLLSAGFSSAEASSVFAMRGRMLQPRDIPAAASAQRRSIVLVTNINAASPSELATLGAFMNDGLIGEIIAYRNDQPFGSRAEIQQFFTERSMLSQFRQIERFINVR
jgi:DNA uptake protein ComE-like DNA-binding protein